jgi:arylsulfatase B
MKIKNLIVFVASGLGLVAALSAVTAEKRPNILVILADDLGYSDVGFNGGKDVQTPSLDKLARGGTIFTSAYVAHPFCGPSRTSIMTGRYPHPLGAPFNLPNSGDGIERYNQLGVPTSEPFISVMLHHAGYYTGAIGKWHLGITAPYHPNARGFDDFYGFLGGGHEYFPAVYGPKYDKQVKAGAKYINEYLVPLEHNGKPVAETAYLTDGFSREAVRFVRGGRRPADAVLPLSGLQRPPHSPLQAKAGGLGESSQRSRIRAVGPTRPWSTPSIAGWVRWSRRCRRRAPWTTR